MCERGRMGDQNPNSQRKGSFFQSKLFLIWVGLALLAGLAVPAQRWIRGLASSYSKPPVVAHPTGEEQNQGTPKRETIGAKQRDRNPEVPPHVPAIKPAVVVAKSSSVKVETENVEFTFSQSIDAAQKAMLGNQWDEAYAAAQNALKLKPGDKRAMEVLDMARDGQYNLTLARAQDAYDLKELDRSQQLLELARQIKPSDTRAVDLRKKLINARYERGITDAKRALESYDWNTAEAKAREALEITPGDEIAKKIIQQARDGPYVTAIAEAEKELTAKHYEKAMEFARTAQKEHPDDKAALSLIQKASEAGYKEALESATQALRDKEWEKASSATDIALKFRPEDSAVREISKKVEDAKFADLIVRAREQLTANDYDKAIELAQGALLVKANDKDALAILGEAKEKKYKNLLAQAQDAIGKEQYDLVRKYAEESLKIKPDDAAAKRIFDLARELPTLTWLDPYQVARDCLDQDVHPNKIRTDVFEQKYRGKKVGYREEKNHSWRTDVEQYLRTRGQILIKADQNLRVVAVLPADQVLDSLRKKVTIVGTIREVRLPVREPFIGAIIVPFEIWIEDVIILRETGEPLPQDKIKLK